MAGDPANDSSQCRVFRYIQLFIVLLYVAWHRLWFMCTTGGSHVFLRLSALETLGASQCSTLFLSLLPSMRER